jgi:hypothetical protein
MGMVRNLRGGAASILMPLMLAACASASKNPVPPPAATPVAPVLDASYDWHGLLLLPFGSVIKDAPFALHEVLMFRDAAHAAQSDDAECYATERTPPRFLKQTPSEYLLCYKHDHLARVEATVNLPLQEAGQIFSDACGLWQRNAGAVHTGAGLPGAVQAGVAPPASPTVVAAAASGEGAGAQAAANAGAGLPAPATATPPGSNTCEGRDGAISYSSRLEENTDRTDRALTIRLDTLAQP